MSRLIGKILEKLHRLTRRQKGALLIIPLLAAAAAVFIATRRPPRTEMARLVPAGSLAFIEVNGLGDVLDGLTHSTAWRELAPELGISSQLGQVGNAAGFMGWSGLGPEEAVIAGRAQLAIALTGLDAETGPSEQGLSLRLRPRFTLIADTHSKPESAARIVKDRLPAVAVRLYGDSAPKETNNYGSALITVYHGPEPQKVFVTASQDRFILIGNDLEAVKNCLDTISGRAGSLADDATLQQNRASVDQDSNIFAFISAAGVQKLSQVAPVLAAGRFTTDPEKISAVSSLVSHISKQAISGMLYGSSFRDGEVVDRYLTVMNPGLASEIASTMKPAAGAALNCRGLIPRDVEDFTVIDVEKVADLPEALLRQVSPKLDLVAGLALREMVINFRRQLGLEPGDAAGDAIGNEIALVKFQESQPMAMILSVKDRARLGEGIRQYLTHSGSSVTVQNYRGTEIAVSSNSDGRSAAFLGDFLVLATRDQIAEMVDAQSSQATMASDDRLKRSLAGKPAGASLVSFRADSMDTAEMMLSIARLTRSNDGSREILDSEPVRRSIETLPPSVSFTEFRNAGIYTETRSSSGNYSLIASLIGGRGEE